MSMILKIAKTTLVVLVHLVLRLVLSMPHTRALMTPIKAHAWWLIFQPIPITMQ